MQRQDADGALAALADETLSDVSAVRAASTPAQLLAPLRPYVEAYLSADQPAAALDALAQFRVLCALREGDTGVIGLNGLVERWLQLRRLPVKGWYNHRPVLLPLRGHQADGERGARVVTRANAARRRTQSIEFDVLTGTLHVNYERSDPSGVMTSRVATSAMAKASNPIGSGVFDGVFAFLVEALEAEPAVQAVQYLVAQ